MANVDNLKKEVDSIKNSLDRLKNNISILSEEDKKNRTDELKKRAELTKMKIQNEINILSIQVGEDKRREKAEAQVLLNTVNDIINLQLSILTWNSGWTTAESTWSWDNWKAKEDGDKSSFWDSWRWKALKRTGIAWGIWAWIAWISSKFKWNDDEEEEEEESKPADESESWNKTKKKKKKKKDKEGWSRLSKFFLWTWITAWTLLWWTMIYKKWNYIKWRFNEKLWNSLSFESALVNVSAEVSSWLIDESPFRYNFDDGIKYNENKQTIKSYDRETKINVKNRTIEWLDHVVFPDYKELIHAANIVNCLKFNFHHSCYDNNPFTRTTGWWWDLQVHLANDTTPECLSASDTNAWAWIWWASWCTLGGLLWAYWWWTMWSVWWAVWWWATWATLWSMLDNNSSMWKTVSTIASWNNFQEFIAYLNKQTTNDWKSLRAHEYKEVVSQSPIQWLWTQILNEILGTYSEDGEDYDRNLNIIQDEEDPSHFLIESYNEKVPLIIEWCDVKWNGRLDYSKIKSIKIGKYKKDDRWKWLEIDFPHNEEWLKEAIRTANLTNKIRKIFHNEWWEKYPFWVKMYGYHRHLQIDTRWWRWEDIVKRDTLWRRFPTIFADLKKQINETEQETLHTQAFYNKDQEWYGSKYIRFLHQMREQNGTQNFWRRDN